MYQNIRLQCRISASDVRICSLSYLTSFEEFQIRTKNYDNIYDLWTMSDYILFPKWIPSRKGKPKGWKTDKNPQAKGQRENLGCNVSIKIYHSPPHSKTKATSQRQDKQPVIKKFNFEILPTSNEHQSQTTCSKNRSRMPSIRNTNLKPSLMWKTTI